MILNACIKREACRTCGGPRIEVTADGAIVMSMCMSLLIPGADWFSFNPEGPGWFDPLPPDHTIMALMRERHSAANAEEVL